MHKSASFAPPPSLTTVEVVPNGVGGASVKRSRSQTAPASAEGSGGMDRAATKVQAMFRGRSARAGHGAVVKARREQSLVDSLAEQTATAAARVQATFRGRSSRRQLSGAGASSGDADAATATGDVEMNAAAAAEEGTLRVQVIRARGLLAADRNGLSDPFVTLAVAGQRHRSRTIKRTLAPEWDEVVEFEGSLDALVAEGVALQVCGTGTLARLTPTPTQPQPHP